MVTLLTLTGLRLRHSAPNSGDDLSLRSTEYAFMIGSCTTVQPHRNLLSPEEGYEAARGAALSVIGSLKRELGDLDRVSAWLMVHGLVNAAPGFEGTAGVINGFSDLILDLSGPQAGMHARMAPGVATLPLNHAVFVGTEVEIGG
jgi:YjgF/chorismate_mutase-like, putative endoribonuclease